MCVGSLPNKLRSWRSCSVNAVPLFSCGEVKIILPFRLVVMVCSPVLGSFLLENGSMAFLVEGMIISIVQFEGFVLLIWRARVAFFIGLFHI